MKSGHTFLATIAALLGFFSVMVHNPVGVTIVALIAVAFLGLSLTIVLSSPGQASS